MGEKIKLKWLFVFFLLIACVDKINFNTPSTQSQIIVEGSITDSPGPYTVKLSTSISLTADSSYRNPIQKASIKLFDDEGNTESFVESTPGVYITSNHIQGKMGHSYHIEIETQDGKVLKSEPDMINPVGEIQAIRYSYEARTIQTNYGEIQGDIFNIFLDATAGAAETNYVRWRYTGTFKVVTNPELHQTFSEGFYYSTPFPCSGYVVNPGLGGGILTKIGECTCCTCWVNQYEAKPTLSDGQLVANNQYRNLKVGEVSINNTTFSDKYMVVIEQMSLTRNAYDFFNLIRAQKEGTTSLFQPPSGKIVGNISSSNSDDQVVGIFWATSINSKYLFIPRSAVPYKLTPMDQVTEPCLDFINSSTTKPPFWQ